MTQIRVRFTFDYVDPGSYLAHAILDRWAEGHRAAVSISWRPLELRTPDMARLAPAAPDWTALMTGMEALAAREGIPFAWPSFIPWTRKAHELAFHAREKGCFTEVHRALFEAHFSGRRDIGRIDHLVALGADHGLEPAEARAVLGVDRFVESVEAARREALECGIRGVPVLETGAGKLEGLVDPERLRSLLLPRDRG